MRICDKCIHDKVCLLSKSRASCSLFDESRPHGEWVWKKDEDALRTYDLLCSECGYKTFTCENYDNVEQAKKVVDDRLREGKTLFPFCPNCGAKMSANDRQVTGKLNSEIEKSKSEIVPDYRDGWRLKEGDQS